MPIDRRQMLSAALGFSAAAMTGLPSHRAAAAMTYDEAARTARAPLQGQPRNRELVRFATLAANSHNTQPWIFTTSSKSISIEPDFARRCPVVDPDDHHLFVSLGCAAENLVLAASALGLRASPRLEGDGIMVELEAAAPAKSALIEAIPLRQSTRAKFDGKPVATDTLRLLEEACREPGISAMMLTERSMLTKVADYVIEGNSAQMHDRAFMDELVSWLRFSEADAVATMDGLSARASGNPELPAWLAQRLLRFVLTAKGENKKYREQIDSSAGIVVISADASDKTGWIAVGRACQRFGLQATALGLKYAFINQPVEVTAVRAQFATFLGIGQRRPDIAMRFGAGPDLPKSLRRAPEQVMREA